MFNFQSQVVIITGASGNLGRAVVRAFQEAGAHIVTVDRSKGKAESLFPELAGSREHLLEGGVDVTNLEEMERLTGRVNERFGRIDALVNTVGGYQAGTPVHETALETWDLMLNMNARSVFVVSRAVLPVMLRQGHGKIVNISSHSGLAAPGNDSAYSAAKSAVARLTESMAAEYKQHGVQVNAVIPAAMVTAEELKAEPAKGVTPEAVAQVILFLCSPAGSIINGALIPAYGLRY